MFQLIQLLLKFSFNNRLNHLKKVSLYKNHWDPSILLTKLTEAVVLTINYQLVFTENDYGLSIRHICKVLPVESYGQQLLIVKFF